MTGEDCVSGTCTKAACTSARVSYSDTCPEATSINPSFSVTLNNDSADPVALQDLAVLYYVTVGGAEPMVDVVRNYDASAPLLATIEAGTLVLYFEITTTIAPGASRSWAIDYYTTDWLEYDTTNDYSRLTCGEGNENAVVCRRSGDSWYQVSGNAPIEDSVVCGRL